jgi:hypothetical protein
LPWWIKLLPILAIAVFVALVVPQVKEVEHAALHEEAAMIRQCFNDPQNWLARFTWLNSAGLQRDHILCQLPDGRVGDRVVQWCKNAGWKEVTAFIIGDGDLATAIRTLRGMACTQVWP